MRSSVSLFKHILFCLILGALLMLQQSCSIRKLTGKDNHLLVKVSISGAPGNYADNLYPLAKQKPNSKSFFFFRLNMWRYIKDKKNPNGGRQKQINKLRAQLDQERKELKDISPTDTVAIRKKNNKILRLENRISERRARLETYRENILEPPVLFDSTQTNVSAMQMRDFLYNKGYFNCEVTYKVKYRRHKAKVYYCVMPGRPFIIKAVDTFIPDVHIAELYTKYVSDALLITDARYDGDILSDERERITTLLRNNGYYNFSRQYIYFGVDTTLKGNYVNVALHIDNPEDRNAHMIYKVNNVYVTPEYNIDDTLRKDTTLSNGNYFISGSNKVKPRVLSRFIFLKKGNLYSQEDYQSTINRLSYLRLYQFIEVNFSIDSSRNHDTALLDCYVNLTPLQRQELGSSLELNYIEENQPQIENAETRSFGTTVSGSYLTRNIAHTAMQLQIRPLGGVEFPISLLSAKHLGDTLNYRYGITNSLIIPRLWLPDSGLFGLFNWVSRQTHTLITSTSFNLNFLHESTKYYSRTTLNTNVTYQWQTRGKGFFLGFPINTYHYFLTPLDVSLINTDYRSEGFKDTVAKTKDPLLINLFDPHLITDLRFVMLINQQPFSLVKSRTTYIRLSGELGGNLLNWFAPRLTDTASARDHRIGNVAYYGYARAEVDTRMYFPLFRKSSNLATRLAIGLGVPMYNSEILPFEKRFVVGGSNSVRAFQLRTIGPGSFKRTTENRYYDRSGDIKVEGSTELRFPMYRVLKGALFVDAGNVWTAKDDPSRLGSVFHFNTFYKQFAIGTGIGLRFDFNFFIFRVDFAVPIHDPAYPEGQRDVIKNYKDAGWLGNNLNINFGVGFPF